MSLFLALNNLHQILPVIYLVFILFIARARLLLDAARGLILLSGNSLDFHAEI